ncbi:MAG: hypothetical protein Q9228_002981 [Teloschistes exilis]
MDTLEELCVSACGPTIDEPEVEEKFQNSCCSNDDEKALNNDEHDACCSSETRKSDRLDRDDSCSGSVNDTRKQGNDSACCRYKPGPCCDVKKRMLYPVVSCFNCSQFRALTALRFESAKTIAVTRLLVIHLKLTDRSLAALLRNTLSDIHNTKPVVRDSACTRGCNLPTQDYLREPKSRFTGRATEAGDGGDEAINVVQAQTGLTDVEKGTFGVEHVALSITGMTCTGCETKLRKVLGTLPPITNLKTSLVMTRAEFSLDTASMSVESVMKHLERTAEFTCERISTRGSNLDVIPYQVNEFLDQPPALGINTMQLISKSVVRINFDPTTVGARGLIEENTKHRCQLAPPPPDPGLAAGSKHVRNNGSHDSPSPLL